MNAINLHMLVSEVIRIKLKIYVTVEMIKVQIAILAVLFVLGSDVHVFFS